MKSQNVVFLRNRGGKLQLKVEVCFLFLVAFGINSHVVPAVWEHFRFANALIWHKPHFFYFHLVKNSCHIHHCHQHRWLCHFSVLRGVFTAELFEACRDYGAKFTAGSAWFVSCQLFLGILMIHIKSKQGAPYFIADPVEVPSSGVGAGDLQRCLPSSTTDSRAHWQCQTSLFGVLCCWWLSFHPLFPWHQGIISGWIKSNISSSKPRSHLQRECLNKGSTP